MSKVLKEFDLATLTEGIPGMGLEAGDVGTVVFVHENGLAYEVEFVAGNGSTVAVETLTADKVEPFEGYQILHARRLAGG